MGIQKTMNLVAIVGMRQDVNVAVVNARMIAVDIFVMIAPTVPMVRKDIFSVPTAHRIIKIHTEEFTSSIYRTYRNTERVFIISIPWYNNKLNNILY
tara:strand:+ start:291 stop:581 length:291 start_codon:yes stop_codon:yes gene_type:complete